MTQAYGWDTAKAFDPCSLPQDIARNLDGSLVDGRTIEWESPVYYNPPCSQTEEWMDKIKAEVRKDAMYYFKSGQTRKGKLVRMHEECDISTMRWCPYDCGILHTFRWKNFLSGPPHMNRGRFSRVSLRRQLVRHIPVLPQQIAILRLHSRQQFFVPFTYLSLWCARDFR